MKNLDYKKMVQDIDELVNNDFVAEMECAIKHHHRPREISQDEAVSMAKILLRVYSISHGIHCVCGNKYIKDL